MLHRNLMEAATIRDQQINARNMVSRLSGKSLKLLPPDVIHCQAKMHSVRFLVSVGLSLRPFVS